MLLWRVRRLPARAATVSGSLGALGFWGGEMGCWGRGEEGRRELRGGSMRMRRFRRRRSAAASSGVAKERKRRERKGGRGAWW